MAYKELFNKKLLVEGNDDKHVIIQICQRSNININFDIINCDGIKNLFDELPRRFKQTDIETIGIIIDADDNIAGRWQRITSMLFALGFNVPQNITASGLLLTHPASGLKAGIWIMPDNNQNGIIEDFIRFLIPENDNLLPEAITILNSIEKQQFHRYSPVHKPKALIHTWLAWQEDPGTSIGMAITKKYLDTENTAYTLFTEWLTSVYSD